MPSKQELLSKFAEIQTPGVPVQNENCTDCKHCADCRNCVSCTACTHCVNCYHCEGCDFVHNAVLCTGLQSTHQAAYYLLNEQVTKAEFDDAVAALGDSDG